MRWWRRPRNFAIGQLVASVVFIVAGIAGLAKPSLLGGRTLAIIVLILGLWSAVLARRFWPARNRRDRG